MKDDEENVYKQIDVVAGEMEHLFHHLFSPRSPARCVSTRTWSPLSDVYETADKLIVKTELAGVRRQDLGITLEEDHLIIRGVRNEDVPAEILSYHQMEINYGYFERVFHLRPGVRQEDITAHFEDGFLTVSIEKQPPPKKDASVEIKVK